MTKYVIIDHFLTLVKNADCVVTNSFHGTAFSIIYKKKFITVPHSTRGNRMIELLGKLGLNYCLWGSKEFSFEREIDYTATYNKLQMLRDDSIKYLTDALNGKSGETTKCNSGWMQTSNNEASVTEEYSGLQAYSGYYYDDNILKQSASGGAADVLARQVLEENGVVFGVAYSENFKSAGYICIESPDDLHLIRGSKYIVPNKQILIEGKYYSIYEVIEQKLKQNKKVLFIGLGCDVGAVKKYLEVNSIDDSNLYTIDLICHGPTFQAVQEDYINALEKKFASKIVEFSMRYKKKEWTPPYVYAAFANGKKYYKPFYETDLGYAFKVYSRKACFNCKYKGHNHIADLTVGDYWGLKPGMVGYNPKGVSIILSRTEKGSHMISQINKDRFA